MAPVKGTFAPLNGSRCILVEVVEAVTTVEGQDIICGVGLGGRGHSCHWAALKADCWDGSENCVFFL